MKNKKIIISFVLILFLNIFLIFSGIIIQSNNIDVQREEFYDEFTSKVFVSTVTKKETNDINEMKSLIDGEWVDTDGNTQTGFELNEDKEIVEDHSKVIKKTISTSVFSNSVNWTEIDAVTPVAKLETGKNAAKAIVFDKGAESDFWSDFPGVLEFQDKADEARLAAVTLHTVSKMKAAIVWPIVKDALELPDNTFKDMFVKLWDGDLNKITIAAINAAVPGLGTLLYNKGGLSGLIGFLGDVLEKLADIVDNVLLYGLDGMGVRLIDKIDIFTYDEEIDGKTVEVTYDFSSYVTKDQIYGVEGSMLGVLNWTPAELHKFFSTVSISTDLFNHGDLHKTITLSTAFKVNSDSYFEFTKFLSKIEDEYEGIPYETYRIVETADGGWTVASKKTNTITSEGEAFFYWVYDKLDYKELLDNALTIDGLISYDYKYVSDIYGNSRYSSEDFVSGEGQDSIYTKGQLTDITFGNFLILTKSFKPLLRSTNYEELVWSVAKEIYN